MVAIVAFWFIAFLIDAFYDRVHLLCYGYIAVSIITIMIAMYDCSIVAQSGVGSCYAVSSVFDDLALNMAAVFVSWVLNFPVRLVGRKFIARA